MEILLLTALLVLSAGGVEIKPVHPGEDVTLTGPDCSSNDSVRLKRKDSDKYIGSCIDGHVLRPDRQDPWFVGRVERMKCPMDEIVSVTLKNVTREDAGEYEWFWKNSSGNFNSTFYLNVTEPDDADGGNTSGNTPSGNTTSGNTTSGHTTSRNNTSGGNTSGNTPDVGVIVGGIVAVLLIVMMIILCSCRSRFRCRLCRLSDQKNSELPVTYREVQQQQV